MTKLSHTEAELKKKNVAYKKRAYWEFYPGNKRTEIACLTNFVPVHYGFIIHYLINLIFQLFSSNVLQEFIFVSKLFHYLYSHLYYLYSHLYHWRDHHNYHPFLISWLRATNCFLLALQLLQLLSLVFNSPYLFFQYLSEWWVRNLASCIILCC